MLKREDKHMAKEKFDTSKLGLFVEIYTNNGYIHASARIREKDGSEAYGYALRDFKLTAQGNLSAYQYVSGGGSDTDSNARMYAVRFEGEANLSDISGIYHALMAVNKKLTKFEDETGLTHETLGGVVFMLAKVLGIDSIYIERKNSFQYTAWQDRFTYYIPKDAIDCLNWRIENLNPHIKKCDRLSFQRIK
jgi:hypothetical protein